MNTLLRNNVFCMNSYIDILSYDLVNISEIISFYFMKLFNNEYIITRLFCGYYSKTITFEYKKISLRKCGKRVYCGSGVHCP